MRIPLKSGLLSCFKRLSTAIYSCLLQKMVFVGVEKPEFKQTMQQCRIHC